MFKIINKQILAKGIKRFDIHAPQIAAKARPGQFVSIAPRVGDKRIPLTIIEADTRRKSITVIVHEVGETSTALAELTLRDPIYSILGPLGTAVPIEKKGRVLCVATGIGAAQILPVARALREAGNKVIGIMGAKTKKEILLEAQMRLTCNKLLITTNDGTYERKGLATEAVREYLEKDSIDAVYAFGSADMMEAVSEMTRPDNTETTVYLSPMMVDCVGVCGSCRVRVGYDILLSCTDGPAFNGHQVDFNDYRIRLNAYKKEIWLNQTSPSNRNTSERKTLKRFLAGILSE